MAGVVVQLCKDGPLLTHTTGISHRAVRGSRMRVVWA